jgi:DNA-binding response OmpR family regulator
MNILIVEDDARVMDFLARGLRAEGHGVREARTGGEGLAMGRAAELDVIVLDLMLPDLQGTEICARLRDEGVLTPILMLTALDSVEDKVDGLRQGADDYLTKPFAFEELLARLAALVRRGRRFRTPPPLLRVGDLVLDRERVAVERNGRAITLTAKELAILELLMSEPGRVFTRDRILAQAWGTDTDPLTNIVDVYIARLRRKIDGAGEAELIATVRGHGYRIGP